jgi:hypothetical protein
VALSLSGEKNGRRIGIKLSTVQRSARASEKFYATNNLCAT